jgi:hypothetical protein
LAELTAPELDAALDAALCVELDDPHAATYSPVTPNALALNA